MVELRREELREQIAVRRVHHNHIEVGLEQPLRHFAVLTDDGLHVLDGHLAYVACDSLNRDGGRGDGRAGSELLRSRASGVHELDGELSAVAVRGLTEPAQIRYVVVARHVERAEEVDAVYVVNGRGTNRNHANAGLGLHLDVAQQLARDAAGGCG